MKKRLLPVVLALSLTPGHAWAFIDLGQGDWLSGQNGLLIELLATEADSLANLTSILANIRMVTQAANEGLALARSTYRAYQVVKDYSAKDLLRDAKRGLYKAFPDLEKIETDVIEMGDQWENKNQFFSYWGRYDADVARRLDKVLAHTYKATIWPHVFPSAMANRKNPSPVDRKIWRIYEKSGMAAEQAYKKTAMAALAQKVANLVSDAEKSKNVELQTQAANASANHQNMVANQERTDLAKIEAAKRENEKEKLDKRNRAIDAALGEQNRLKSMFQVGGKP